MWSGRWERSEPLCICPRCRAQERPSGSLERGSMLQPETGCGMWSPEVLESHLMGLPSEAGHGRPDLRPSSFSEGQRIRDCYVEYFIFRVYESCLCV